MDQIPDQPLDRPVDFTGATPPAPTELRGRFVVLRPIDPERDAEPLYAASHEPTGDPSVWTYLYEGPWPDLDSFREALREQATRGGYVFFTITRAEDGERGENGEPQAKDGRPVGILAYMSIVPEYGVIEIGNIWFGPELKRTPAATETIYLLARHAFDTLGYRRLEWKCHALNQPSRDAAARFGFRYEGTFANHRIVRGRNRDTAWFATTVERWPGVRTAFETWLSPENFDADGRQRTRLSDLTAEALAAPQVSPAEAD